MSHSRSLTIWRLRPINCSNISDISILPVPGAPGMAIRVLAQHLLHIKTLYIGYFFHRTILKALLLISYFGEELMHKAQGIENYKTEQRCYSYPACGIPADRFPSGTTSSHTAFCSKVNLICADLNQESFSALRKLIYSQVLFI